MFGRRDKRRPVDEAEVEGLRRFYGALGLGFPMQALRIFGGNDADHGAYWCLRHMGRKLRCVSAVDLSNHELFALPQGWEVIRVVAASLTGRKAKLGDQISVQGELYCRPRGTWETLRLPFVHTWTMRAGRAVLFENLLDQTDLRLEGMAGLQAA